MLGRTLAPSPPHRDSRVMHRRRSCTRTHTHKNTLERTHTHVRRRAVVKHAIVQRRSVASGSARPPPHRRAKALAGAHHRSAMTAAAAAYMFISFFGRSWQRPAAAAATRAVTRTANSRCGAYGRVACSRAAASQSVCSLAIHYTRVAQAVRVRCSLSSFFFLFTQHSITRPL